LIDINAKAPPRAYLGTRIKGLSSKWGMKEMQKTKSGVRKSSSGQGFCCPHCSDSKFPCVNMEQLMRDGGAAAKPDRGKIEEK